MNFMEHSTAEMVHHCSHDSHEILSPHEEKENKQTLFWHDLQNTNTEFIDFFLPVIVWHSNPVLLLSLS